MRRGITSLRRDWYAAASGLTIGIFFWGLVFNQEISSALEVWISSTAFNHCFLVLPVAAYLTWQRREVLAVTPPQPLLSAALAALPVTVCWLVAERIGIMEARQLLAMILVQLLFLSVLGLRAWRGFSAPLLYLFFLIPVGEFLVPMLQQFVVHFITSGLDLLGIINYVDGVVIDIPEGRFLVAEACAGLRFLIASLAFGVLYSIVMYRSPFRRFVFVLLSIIVPIIANGFRALGIVVAGHL